MDGHSDSVTCMAIDANFLFTGGYDCKIKKWDLINFAPAGDLGELKTPVQSLLFI